MIGDPSGRSDMRQMMTVETIQHNCDCLKKQMSRFIEFGEDKALMVNNADWLMNLNYIECAAGGGSLLFRQQHAAGRMLQTEDGERVKLPGIQLHDHAELRFLRFVPKIRLQYAVRRRRPVEQHAGGNRADPQKKLNKDA
jgi:hypothetical protein